MNLKRPQWWIRSAAALLRIRIFCAAVRTADVVVRHVGEYPAGSAKTALVNKTTASDGHSCAVWVVVQTACSKFCVARFDYG